MIEAVIAFWVLGGLSELYHVHMRWIIEQEWPPAWIAVAFLFSLLSWPVFAVLTPLGIYRTWQDRELLREGKRAKDALMQCVRQRKGAPNETR